MRSLKSLIVVSLFLLIHPFCSFAQLNGDQWSKVKSTGKGELTICYYETPAFIFKNEQGKPEGICAEIFNDFKKYVENKYSVELTYNFVESEKQFSSFLNEVRQANHGVIGVGNVSVTEERKQQLRFTNPYFRNLTVFLTHKSAQKLHSLDDLADQFKGYKALVVKGSTYEKLIKEIKKEYMPSLQIEYVASGKLLLKEITSRPDTFTVTDFIEYYFAIKQHMPVRSHLSSKDLPYEKLAFIMPKNADWQGVFNEFLNERYTKSVQYRKIVNNHLGAAFVNLLDKI